ncbi:MAG TPA: carboxypeptidase regulatory-like domain-containing protein [Candidatus Angelobacter sp.]
MPVKYRISVALVPLFALLAGFAQTAFAQTTTEKLPVKRVVLYKNGVGYFEHTGRVRGDQEIKIDFTSSQLNDVLKSLTVLDLNGGKITGVGYNSVAPIDEQLKALRLPLGQSTTLANFLSALRGSRIQVRNGAAVVSGRLLSVEERTTRKAQEETTKSLEVAVVTDAGEVRTFTLTSGLSVRVEDHDLNEEISRYLSLVSSSRDQDLRRMTISTSGIGDRSVFVSYISEVPVWKSTYRILLPAKADSKPLLQGWAIVDNTVGEDWKDVELSLVAGAPQSFIQDLSKPYYTRRPVIELPETAMLTPQTHEGTITYDAETLAPASPPPMAAPKPGSFGVAGGVGSGSGGGYGPEYGRNAGGVVPILHGIYGKVTDPMEAVVANAHVTATNGAGESQTAESDSNGEFRIELPPGNYQVSVQSIGFTSALQKNVQVAAGPRYLSFKLAVGASNEAVEVTSESEKLEPAATGEDLGDLFAYNLKEKVTILKNHSALVPIINSHVDAEKVTLWNSSSGRPLRALWITNSSGLTLDSGSFNVIENNEFAGEGLIDPLKPKERRLLSYAVDQAVRVEVQDDAESKPVTHIKIARGVIVQTSEQVDHMTYTLRNTDSAVRDVIIEHPVHDGWKLAKDLKPEETTASSYRFRVKVQPNQTATLKVDEFEPIESKLALANVTDDQINLFFRQKTIKPEVEQALRKIIQQKNEIAGFDHEIQGRQNQVNTINQDQQRLRENMKALKGSAEEKALLQRYTHELNDQEDKLESVRAEISKLELKRTESRQQLDRMLQELTLDEAI